MNRSNRESGEGVAMRGVLGIGAVLVAAAILNIPARMQAQASKARRASPVVKRAADPEAIEAAAGNLAIALHIEWNSGSQEVIAVKGCNMTVQSSQKTLGMMTVDEQTFDAGDLTGDLEPGDGIGAFEMKLYSTPKLRPFVTRKRTLYVDGAPKAVPSEKVVYLSIRVPRGEAATVTEPVLMAIRSYRNFCQRA